MRNTVNSDWIHETLYTRNSSKFNLSESFERLKYLAISRLQILKSVLKEFSTFGELNIVIKRLDILSARQQKEIESKSKRFKKLP